MGLENIVKSERGKNSNENYDAWGMLFLNKTLDILASSIYFLCFVIIKALLE